MEIITSPAGMAAWSGTFRKNGATIGLVPTMGALHKGHLSLVAEARRCTDATVLSIFVNPTQFGPCEDYRRYPRMFEADCEKARVAGCSIVFAPTVSAMYPAGYKTFVEVEELGGTLCGITRPTHFRGVATVVLKLINIVRPDLAVFGQKDAQQVIVLKRMTVDLNVAVTITVCPTVREADGLAMSSRNAYLTHPERTAAPLIYKGLSAAAARYDNGERNAAELVETVKKIIAANSLLTPEYVEIVDMMSLRPLAELSNPALMAVACRTGGSKTRLIDNIILGGSW